MAQNLKKGRGTLHWLLILFIPQILIFRLNWDLVFDSSRKQRRVFLKSIEK
jgi:hypothetical protein